MAWRECDRRQFLALVAAGPALALGWRRWTRLSVEAATTVFWSQPDGRDSLVRFLISGSDAPAGRLRVFDSTGRLLGTAGVVKVAEDGLYGELWLPLLGPTRIRSELTVPGARAVSSAHLLVPQPRWSIYWLPIVSSKALRERLSRLPVWRRAVELALLQRCRVAVNPLPSEGLRPELLDHWEFLHLLRPAALAAADSGLALSRIAVTQKLDQAPAALALLLRDGNVPYVVTTAEETTAPYWLEGPGGARVLVVPAATGLSSTALGFARGGDLMAGQIERWLRELAAQSSSPESMALLVETALPEELPASYDNVEAWNRRYAYPRIVVSEAEEFFRSRASQATAIRHTQRQETGPTGATLGSRQIAEIARRREASRARRRDEFLTLFAAVLGSVPERLAAKPMFPLPGWLVFNCSPYTRSDLVELRPGRFQVVTDVPGTGYVYLADLESSSLASWTDAPASAEADLVLENERLRIQLDPATGGIASLRDRLTGSEWVAAGKELNRVAAARLERASRQQLEEIASRIVASRWVPGHGVVETTVTLYRHLAWIDIENRAEAAGGAAVPYEFGLPLASPEVEWETPLGLAAGALPLEPIAALRWISVQAGPGPAFLSAIDTPFVSASSDGALVFWGGSGWSRFRLAVGSELARADEPLRLGWSTDKLVALPVGGGYESGLPRWGRLLEIEQPGVALVGMEREGPDTAVVYLQELLGVPATTALRSEIVTFDTAELLDLGGKKLETLEGDGRSGVRVTLAPRGVSAVRLLGLRSRWT